jgi:hypothetical protein
MALIKDEYYVNLKGKRHPVYEGVLVALHENGLLGIEVTVLQYPCQENGMTAVCQATVTMRGEDGRELIFSEVGDASPANVGHHIAPHIIRMAATRAKGRAGRDALALGVALLEEMGPEVEAHNGQQARPEARAAPQRARRDPEDEATQDDPNDPLCEWPDCPRHVGADQSRRSREHFDKTLCANHEAQLAVVRSKKATRPSPVTTETATV